MGCAAVGAFGAFEGSFRRGVMFGGFVGVCLGLVEGGLGGGEVAVRGVVAALGGGECPFGGADRGGGLGRVVWMRWRLVVRWF